MLLSPFVKSRIYRGLKITATIPPNACVRWSRTSTFIFKFLLTAFEGKVIFLYQIQTLIQNFNNLQEACKAFSNFHSTFILSWKRIDIFEWKRTFPVLASANSQVSKFSAAFFKSNTGWICKSKSVKPKSVNAQIRKIQIGQS